MKYSTMRFLLAGMFAAILALTVIFRHDIVTMNRNILAIVFAGICLIYCLLLRAFPQRKKEDRGGWNVGIDVIGGLALSFLLIWLFKDYECTDPFVDPSRSAWWLASILMIANLRMGILARKSGKYPDTLTQ